MIYLCIFPILTTIVHLSQASVVRDDVTFYLYTKNNLQNYVQLDYENAKDNLQNYDEIIFLIHGWTQNRSVEWFEDLKNAYLARHDKIYTIIEVDWSKPAAQNYFNAARDVSAVGDVIADFIININSKGVPLEQIHVCGHSLGAQVAGFTGKQVFRKLSRRVARITALDPAGPFFQGILVSYRDRLNRHDAEIVFVIHTDRKLFGFFAPCGTIDVFPNGGAGVQPGCPDRDRGETLFCSHHKSYEYYIDAIENPQTLLATMCYSYSAFDSGMCEDNRRIDIGGDVTREQDGNYYLYTNPKKPYGLKTLDLINSKPTKSKYFQY